MKFYLYADRPQFISLDLTLVSGENEISKDIWEKNKNNKWLQHLVDRGMAGEAPKTSERLNYIKADPATDEDSTPSSTANGVSITKAGRPKGKKPKPEKEEE